MTPKMRIVWSVLEAAKDAGDETVIAACRALIVANRAGTRNETTATAYRIVLEFYA